MQNTELLKEYIKGSVVATIWESTECYVVDGISHEKKFLDITCKKTFTDSTGKLRYSQRFKIDDLRQIIEALRELLSDQQNKEE